MQFRVARATAAFRYIRRNGNGTPPHLTGQSITNP
jgi:hypothetical protein